MGKCARRIQTMAASEDICRRPSLDGSATDGATTGDQFQINTNGAVTTQGADLPEGGETTGVVENGETPKNGQGVGGVYIPARK